MDAMGWREIKRLAFFVTAAKVRVKSSEVKSTDPTDGYIQYKLKILYLYKASVRNFIYYIF